MFHRIFSGEIKLLFCSYCPLELVLYADCCILLTFSPIGRFEFSAFTVPPLPDRDMVKNHKRVFDLVIDFGTSQSPKSTRPLTTYWCPSRPGHQALRNNFASSLLLRTWLPMTGRRVRRPTLFSLWRKARRENSAASRLLGSTSLRFALHAWQRLFISLSIHPMNFFVSAKQSALLHFFDRRVPG